MLEGCNQTCTTCTAVVLPYCYGCTDSHRCLCCCCRWDNSHCSHKQPVLATLFCICQMYQTLASTDQQALLCCHCCCSVVMVMLCHTLTARYCTSSFTQHICRCHGCYGVVVPFIDCTLLQKCLHSAHMGSPPVLWCVLLILLSCKIQTT